MSEYVLLTGGTGFIGSHLLEELLNQNKKVILLKRSFSNTWKISEFLEHENLTLKNIDEDNLSDIFNQYDINGIFHLSAFMQRKHESESIKEMIDSNITFPCQLLENSINSNVKFFINTGSFFEYKLANSPISENHEIESFNLYGATKTAFEDILKFYQNSYGLNCSTLKLFTPYGPKDDERKIVPYLIINSLKKNDILIKSPDKILDFIYVTDIADAYISVMNSISKFKDYNSFNVGTGIGTTIKDVLAIIESKLGKNENVSFENVESDKVWCSNEKIKELTGWTAKTKLEDGIGQTIRYYKNRYGI